MAEVRFTVGTSTLTARIPVARHLPSGWDLTGSVDHTQAMANWLTAKVSPGDEIVFPPNAAIRLDRGFQLVNRRHLTIRGNRSTIIQAASPIGPPWYPGVFVSESESITFYDLRVKGPRSPTSDVYDPLLESHHAWDLRASKGIVLVNCGGNDVHGDLIYLGHRGGGGPWVENVWIVGGSYERSGRQGVAMVGARNVMIDGLRLGGARRSLFDFEPAHATAGVENVWVRNISCGKRRLNLVAAAAKPCHDITLENFQLDYPDAVNIYVRPGLDPNGKRYRCRNWTIRKLDGVNTTGGPWTNFYHVDGLTVDHEIRWTATDCTAVTDIRGTRE